MKKLLWPLCTLLVLLTAFGLGLTAAYLAEELTYDQIKNSGCGIPEIAAHTITILHEGDYPGMSDFPVSAEQAAPGRAALNALRGQRYTRILHHHTPERGTRAGGIKRSRDRDQYDAGRRRRSTVESCLLL